MVAFNSAMSSESKKQSKTKFVFKSHLQEYSGFIFLITDIILSITFSEISTLELNVDFCKSLIDQGITPGSL